MTTFTCSNCGKEKQNDSTFTTGYGTDKDGNKHCYDCCGEMDRKEMETASKFILYLNSKEMSLGNWCGTFKIKLHHIRTGMHNIAGKRYDYWFKYAGKNWHGTTYGDFTQIAHCKVVK